MLIPDPYNFSDDDWKKDSIRQAEEYYKDFYRWYIQHNHTIGIHYTPTCPLCVIQEAVGAFDD